MGFAKFQKVDRAAQVVLDQLAGTCLAIHSRQHAGIRGGIDDDINGLDGLQVAGGADVSMENFDAELLKFGSIHLASRTDEIVDSEDFQVGAVS